VLRVQSSGSLPSQPSFCRTAWETDGLDYRDKGVSIRRRIPDAFRHSAEFGLPLRTVPSSKPWLSGLCLGSHGWLVGWKPGQTVESSKPLSACLRPFINNFRYLLWLSLDELGQADAMTWPRRSIAGQLLAGSLPPSRSVCVRYSILGSRHFMDQ
jgi:hypothetical protein